MLDLSIWNDQMAQILTQWTHAFLGNHWENKNKLTKTHKQTKHKQTKEEEEETRQHQPGLAIQMGGLIK